MKPCIGTLRKQQGMTQEALAKELGCSRSALAGWETALHGVPVQLLWKLARCLHVPVDALYEPDEDPTPMGDHPSVHALPIRQRRGSRAPH